MEKLIAAVITDLHADDAMSVSKFYAYESSWDLLHALRDLSPDISNKNRNVSILITAAVDVSVHYDCNGTLEIPFDKNQIAFEDLNVYEGLIVYTDDFYARHYVIDPNYAIRDCDVFFNSSWYHEKTGALPEGVERILAVETVQINRGADGDRDVYYERCNSWEDVLRIFDRFDGQICGGSSEKYVDVTISLPKIVTVDNDVYQSIDDEDDFCYEIIKKHFDCDCGGELIELNGKRYVIALNYDDRIFSTSWWETRFTK